MCTWTWEHQSFSQVRGDENQVPVKSGQRQPKGEGGPHPAMQHLSHTVACHIQSTESGKGGLAPTTIPTESLSRPFPILRWHLSSINQVFPTQRLQHPGNGDSIRQYHQYRYREKGPSLGGCVYLSEQVIPLHTLQSPQILSSA